MRAEYTDVSFFDNQEQQGDHKIIELPFRRSSSRALIVRRKDGAILGTLHHLGGRYALPGGAIDDGESSAQAVLRELEEENIQLIGNSEAWLNRFTIDYYDGYHELSIWHIFDVEDAIIGECEETIESRWVQQTEGVWHPFMREKITLSLNQHLSEYANLSLRIE